MYKMFEMVKVSFQTFSPIIIENFLYEMHETSIVYNLTHKLVKNLEKPFNYG